MLSELLDLPDEFSGVLTTGGLASNLLGLACARQWIGQRHGVDVAEEGIHALEGKRILVLGTMPHQSITKAMGILGLGRKVRHVLPEKGRTARICVKDLETLLSTAAGDETISGCVVIAQAGEVNTSDCDDIAFISSVCKRYGAWLHVDGAANLLARCSPTYADYLNSLELADSITGDAHKWLNQPYDCGIFFTRHAAIHQAAFSSTASYLGASAGFAPINLGIENSRRFRALPLWFSLNVYGRAGFQQIVERTCSFAKALGTWIEESSEYELLEPVRLNTVLFRARGTPKQTATVLTAVNATGKLFMTPTQWLGSPAIRAAIANWSTAEGDLPIVIEGLKQGYRAAMG